MKMKNLIFVNIAVLLVVILSSITANANTLKVNENLLVNHPEICSKQGFCD